MFVNFVATLPDKHGPTEDNGTKTVLTAGGYSIPRKMPLLFPIETLSPNTKRFLYQYDCDCVPIFENPLGHFQAIEELAQLWGVQPSPTSPANSPIGSPATNDPNPIVTLPRKYSFCIYFTQYRYKTKNSYRFNHGQNFWEYGVNRAVRTQFR